MKPTINRVIEKGKRAKDAEKQEKMSMHVVSNADNDATLQIIDNFMLEEHVNGGTSIDEHVINAVNMIVRNCKRSAHESHTKIVAMFDDMKQSIAVVEYVIHMYAGEMATAELYRNVDSVGMLHTIIKAIAGYGKHSSHIATHMERMAGYTDVCLMDVVIAFRRACIFARGCYNKVYKGGVPTGLSRDIVCASTDDLANMWTFIPGHELDTFHTRIAAMRPNSRHPGIIVRDSMEFIDELAAKHSVNGRVTNVQLQAVHDLKILVDADVKQRLQTLREMQETLDREIAYTERVYNKVFTERVTCVSLQRSFYLYI